jgi:hypothetical protein
MGTVGYTGLQEAEGFLAAVRAEVGAFIAELQSGGAALTTKASATLLAGIEALAKTVEAAQLVGAHLAAQQDIARAGETDSISLAAAGAERGQDRNSAEYLRRRLGMPLAEAKRRLRLAEDTQPGMLLDGRGTPPRLPVLAAALAAGKLDSRTASVICQGIAAVRSKGSAADLEAMERALVAFAIRWDTDALRRLLGKWQEAIDPDGKEPSEARLRTLQGLHGRGKRDGLHLLEIVATDEQYEVLASVFNTGANPRLRAGTATAGTVGLPAGALSGPDGIKKDPLDGRTRPQKQLDALVGACQVALGADKLPASGGQRPQVLVTIDYRDLLDRLGRAGRTPFAGSIPANAVRRIACDAEIIPVVLAGNGRILDLGRSQRFFPAPLRQAMIARDRGCAFPDCTMPSTWTEAHHITWWENGGRTRTDDGCMLCVFHHHLVHQGDWQIIVGNGIPWFVPPATVDPDRTPIRNHHWLYDAQLPPRRSEPALPPFPGHTGTDGGGHAAACGAPAGTGRGSRPPGPRPSRQDTLAARGAGPSG